MNTSGKWHEAGNCVSLPNWVTEDLFTRNQTPSRKTRDWWTSMH